MDRRNSGGGGMTGATGDLTPDASTRAFEPGELKEVAGPESQADVTVDQASRAPAQAGDIGEPGEDRAEGGPTNMATRESGYGSEHGLSPDDPAYEMEGPTRPASEPEPSSRPETRIGGDDVTEGEEHF
ncbi:MAG: hypothetical protein K5924_07815 [Chloroflexi bacterium]|nr:hypothetical protein [Chloroflexota bacterium]